MTRKLSTLDDLERSLRNLQY